MTDHMKSPWLFYASIKDHAFYIEVTNNNASNRGVVNGLSGRVYTHCPHADEIADLIEEIDELSMEAPSLIRKAEGLCSLIEERFGLKVLYGDDAWHERVKTPDTIIQDKWDTYLKTVGIGGHSNLKEVIVVASEWIIAWEASTDLRKEDYIEFGKKQLAVFTELENA